MSTHEYKIETKVRMSQPSDCFAAPNAFPLLAGTNDLPIVGGGLNFNRSSSRRNWFGAAAFFREITDKASRVGNLEFTGSLPYSSVGDHFDNAVLFVNSSESEVFPNTFLQAWARAVPTVSFVAPGAHREGQDIGRRVNSNLEMIECVDLWMR